LDNYRSAKQRFALPVERQIYRNALRPLVQTAGCEGKAMETVDHASAGATLECGVMRQRRQHSVFGRIGLVEIGSVLVHGE